MPNNQPLNAIIIGAGAAGMMCAIEAGKRGKKVLLIDHAKIVGEKIRISGGGRCNFTNINTSPESFISKNPQFCISALKRYTPNNFIKLIEKYNIPYHEKTLGQLFCDGRSQEIINMLLSECNKYEVEFRLNTIIKNIKNIGDEFIVETQDQVLKSTSLVIATGGPSIPKMGATGFGYEIANQFGLNVITPYPALVPLTLTPIQLENTQKLAGVALDVVASCNKKQFKEAMLFTHRGLSGPAILQISSYWKNDAIITINLAPGHDLASFLKETKQLHPKQELQSFLSQILPKRLAQNIANELNLNSNLADLSNQDIKKVISRINFWQIIPKGTEGYKTAEVTLGGVDTIELSSQTMESKKIPGLYFIGEVVDVTGHLGGFNFQWAWSSGFTAGQFC